MATMIDHRRQAKDPRQELNRLFNMTTTDQEVGSWSIAKEFFSSEFAAALRQESAARRGQIIREAAWRLIEAHDRDFLKHPAKKACAYEKCAERASLQDWHVLALLYSWEPGKGFKKPKTVSKLCEMSAEAMAWHETQKRKQPSPGRKRATPKDARHNDPVLRQGRAATWFKTAKHKGLDALYEHLCDPDDPVVLQVLLEGTNPLPAAVPAPQAPHTPRRESTPPAVTPLPALQPALLPLPTRAPAVEQKTPSPIQPELVRSSEALRVLFPERLPDPLPIEEAVTLPGSETPTAPGTRRFPWPRVKWKRWLSIAVAVAVLFTCLITPGTPPFTSTLTWSAAGLSGWLVARQSISREPRILSVMDLRTGAWRSLWPPQSVITGEAAVNQPLPGTDALTSPSYTPVGHRLAFIARDSNQIAAIYTATVVIGPDGWPVIADPKPRMLLECNCSTVIWTPNGQWLIYNSSAGLAAVATDGKAARVITHNGQDSWPACSPDGRYLAYQQQHEGIVALRTRDCLPDAQFPQRALYLNGYTPAWAPAWSPDSQTLSFVSNVAGRSAVYVTPAINLTDHPLLLSRDTAKKLSGQGCGNPVWVQRAAYLGIQPAPAIVFGCDQPTPDDHHGTLGASSGLNWPLWATSLTEGVVNRDSLCWIPARLQL